MWLCWLLFLRYVSCSLTFPFCTKSWEKNCFIWTLKINGMIKLTRAKGIDPVVAVLLPRCNQVQGVLLVLFWVADLQRCPTGTVRTVEGVVIYLRATTKHCRLHYFHRTHTYAPSLLAPLKQHPIVRYLY